MGSLPTCGGAELSPVISTAECQLPTFRLGCFAIAEKVRKPPSLPDATRSVTAQRIDITLSDGRRILVEGLTALLAVLAMVEGWRNDPGDE